jgi:hypothetical protein
VRKPPRFCLALILQYEGLLTPRLFTDNLYSQKQAKAEEAFTTPDPFAHGLIVQMLEHPCVKERCTYRTQDWKVQTGGADFCVFCMASHTGGSRCPGCEALACKKCLEKMITQERTAFGGLGSRSQYRASGG